jgi:polyprenyl-phospho-N-acetylgalactosaminyl synthase
MFNEAAVVGEVVAELTGRFPLVVCVDDASTDDSAHVARAAGAVVLAHPVNLGQGGALQTGLDFVRTRTDADHVVTFDADGQHSVLDAELMVAHARETGVDVVLGSRRLGASEGSSASRRLLLKAALRYSRWNSGLQLTDTHNGLRVLNRHAMQVVRLRQRGMAHASEIETLIARHGLTWTEHAVTITYTEYSRAKGQSSINAFNVVYDTMISRLGATS